MNRFCEIEKAMPEISGASLTLENYGCQNGFMTQVCCDMTTTPHHMEPLEGWTFAGWCGSPPFTRYGAGPNSNLHAMAVVMERAEDGCLFWWHYTKGKFFIKQKGRSI